MKKNYSNVAAAGEHFVAHKIFCLGYVALLVRQGYPMIDMIVSTESGERTVGIQIKTATIAKRWTGKKGQKEMSELQFTCGHKAVKNVSKIIYCFVDLANEKQPPQPDVYVIPQSELSKLYEVIDISKFKLFRLHQPPVNLEPFKNNWNPIREALA